MGVWAFLLACVLTTVLHVRRGGRAALLGAVLLIASAGSFLRSHILLSGWCAYHAGHGNWIRMASMGAVKNDQRKGDYPLEGGK